MQNLHHPALRFRPFPVTKWERTDKPILIVDGLLHRIRQLNERVSGDAAYVVGASEPDVAALGKLLDVEYLNFYELRADNLAPLGLMLRLRHLKIEWNTKLTSLEGLSNLRKLETLILENTPKTKDLAPLMLLTNLVAFQYSGGTWSKNHAESLAPLAALPKLQELVLMNLRIKEGGLRPLGQCKALQTLAVSNRFETADYAYLSVVLRHVECASFAPWVRVKTSFGPDTMITGKRKPLLNSTQDAKKIIKFEKAFHRLQTQFASNIVLH
jgi:hypothetical protein